MYFWLLKLFLSEQTVQTLIYSTVKDLFYTTKAVPLMTLPRHYRVLFVLNVMDLCFFYRCVVGATGRMNDNESRVFVQPNEINQLSY